MSKGQAAEGDAGWSAALARFDSLAEMTPAARQAELERIRTTDPACHQRLLVLLRADEVAEFDSFVDGAAIADARADEPDEIDPAVPAAVERVGPWRLERSLGAGGMGRVWLARRHDGLYQGQVAIKMLREAVADEHAAARFAREGELLARLNHSNIARLMDAGTLADGQRYLVLEYVRGERIDGHCDGLRLPVAGRVRLFLQVCAAVSHAHANLIVHRDLKPANILVEQDGNVKLLDFGVAKLIEADADESPLTQLAGAGLTPEYAAPEQVEGGVITTATDVYSLGMVLYRLLAGRRPYGEGTASPARLAQEIVDTEARPLSATVGGAAAGEVAGLRQTTPERLRRQLQGDLDNILAKALRKKPTERYASARALMDDLEAYLDNRPVLARPDSVGYLLGKFVRRHRVGVAATAGLVLALVVGVAGIVWQARIALEQKAEAEKQAQIAEAERGRAEVESGRAKAKQQEAERYQAQAQADARRAHEQELLAVKQSKLASEQSARATAVKDFMIDIFRVNAAGSADIEKAQQLTAAQLLDRGSERIAAKFADQPDLRAELFDVVGSLFYWLGDHGKAQALTEQRITTLANDPASRPQARMAAQYNLHQIATARGDPKAARAAIEASVALAEQFGGASEHERVRSVDRLARTEVYRDPRRAIQMAELALAGLDTWDHVTAADRSRIVLYSVIAQAQSFLRRFDLAQAAAESSLTAARKTFGAARYEVAAAKAQLGEIYRQVGQGKRAEVLLRQAVDSQRKTLGRRHSGTLSSQALLGATLFERGQRAEGLALLEEAVRVSAESSRRNLIEDSSMRLELLNTYLADGQSRLAGPMAERLVTELRSNPELRVLLPEALVLRARLAQLQGDAAVAIALVTEAHVVVSAVAGEDSAWAAEVLVALAEAQLAAGEGGDAFELIERLRRLPLPTGQRVAATKLDRDMLDAEFKLFSGQESRAKSAFAEVIAAIDGSPEPEAMVLRQARALLGFGRAAAARDEWRQAEPALQRALTIFQRHTQADSPWLAEARVALADGLISHGDRERARQLLDLAEKAYAGQLPLGRRFLYPLQKVKGRLEPAAEAPAGPLAHVTRRVERLLPEVAGRVPVALEVQAQLYFLHRNDPSFERHLALLTEALRSSRPVRLGFRVDSGRIEALAWADAGD